MAICIYFFQILANLVCVFSLEILCVRQNQNFSVKVLRKLVPQKKKYVLITIFLGWIFTSQLLEEKFKMGVWCHIISWVYKERIAIFSTKKLKISAIFKQDLWPWGSQLPNFDRFLFKHPFQKSCGHQCGTVKIFYNNK